MTETFVMRPATPADRPAVTRMIQARCQWMEERGLPSWRAGVDELAGQCENPDGDVWILEGTEHGVAGQMVVQDQGPPWGWTDEERAEPALYLSGSITDPVLRSRKPGTLMAWWAVDRAARLGVPWVRRHCHCAQVASYNLTQGFELVREEQRTHARLFMMARRAERLDMSGLVRTATPYPPGSE
ncbi:GNAT family N-acetyltransferase [Nonomuraea candida]|uniref:GNAT family N-acetyltransferase n=1 Tax=Nonomuraea candida TaxID=359159 RepID=UPI001FE013DE|nr:GNAT family N-acetyltransferase [Nonomuraea candida]